MRRLTLILTLILIPVFVLALTALEANAQNPHFVGQVRCTEGTDTVTCTGSVAGLGSGDITVVVEASGQAIVECTNPGGNVAPGQTTSVTATGTQSNIEVKNGRANFNVTTLPPPDPNPAVVCPNGKWTAAIVSVDFTSATLKVFQGGVQVLQQTFNL